MNMTFLNSIIISSRVALFLAVFSLVLIGGIYSHGPEVPHTHIASERANSSNHAHVETAVEKSLTSDAIHCGADNIQFAQSSSTNFERNAIQIVGPNFQMGKDLSLGLDPPPPRLYS